MAKCIRCGNRTTVWTPDGTRRILLAFAAVVTALAALVTSIGAAICQ